MTNSSPVLHEPVDIFTAALNKYNAALDECIAALDTLMVTGKPHKLSVDLSRNVHSVALKTRQVEVKLKGVIRPSKFYPRCLFVLLMVIVMVVRVLV